MEDRKRRCQAYVDMMMKFLERKNIDWVDLFIPAEREFLRTPYLRIEDIRKWPVLPQCSPDCKEKRCRKCWKYQDYVEDMQTQVKRRTRDDTQRDWVPINNGIFWEMAEKGILPKAIQVDNLEIDSGLRRALLEFIWILHGSIPILNCMSCGKRHGEFSLRENYNKGDFDCFDCRFKQDVPSELTSAEK